MDNTKTRTTLATQDTKQSVVINVKENRMGNQEWIKQRHRQHWAHKTQNKEKLLQNQNTENQNS